MVDNNHLQIRGIKKTDEGTYTCEARVMARGEIDFRMIKVVVNGEQRAEGWGERVRRCRSFDRRVSLSVLPTIRARQADVNATADIGSSALLACDADGFPEPTVTWA